MINSKETYDVVVIGGGASGLMAAGRAGERKLSVLLLEKNSQLGKKLSITGGKRCNITNATFETHSLLQKYGKARDFLFSPFSQFNVRDTFSFFESRGLPIVTHDERRAFPKSEKALDVTNTLVAYCKHYGVEIKTNTSVTNIVRNSNGSFTITTKDLNYTGNHVIVATGGVSHPETGSTGDGFVWLRNLGHTIHRPTPTIVPLAIKESWIKKLSGITLPEVRITFFLENKKIFHISGTILATHFGITGPIILNCAHKVRDLLEAGKVTALIDLYPHMNIGTLDKHLVSIFDQHKNKTLTNAAKYFTPQGTHAIITSLLPWHASCIVHQISKLQRKQLVMLLKSLPLTITNLMGFNRAVISDGGVSLDEINTRTMESKIVKNLYVIGDLLHINRPSGGYSLQLCWTTGYVAANNLTK